MVRNRRLACLAALTLCGASPAAGARPITCTNPYSGASWQIRLDLRAGTVDSYPARIGPREISWHDARDNGNYTLDRATGALTVIVPSSTGGYFLHDRCRLHD